LIEPQALSKRELTSQAVRDLRAKDVHADFHATTARLAQGQRDGQNKIIVVPAA